MDVQGGRILDQAVNDDHVKTPALADIDDLHPMSLSAWFRFDFANGGDGGALPGTAHDMTGQNVPAGMIIDQVYIDVEEALVSSGGTKAKISVGGQDVLAFTAKGASPFNAVGKVTLTPATPLSVSASTTAKVTISGATLTAGVFNVNVLYFPKAQS